MRDRNAIVRTRRTTASAVLVVAALMSCAGLVVAADAPDAETAQAPLWPLDLETRYLTSNFMEHRPGRFHAGLDFKTDERPGFPVRAAVDGWVTRIRFTAGGYGKAVYVRGRDGRIYVYAHLERLADPLRSLVREAQERRGSWAVSLSFPSGRHPVRRGEVLALSGQSGTSGPHLHFEVRDAENRPLDPQACGFAVADTIPPRILRVRAIPAGPGARVHGGATSRAVGDGSDPLSGRLPDLAVDGQVAFSCRVVEQADVQGHRLEPWRLALTLDDSLVFETRNERLDFSRNHRSRLEWFATGNGRERWLHVEPDDDLAGRHGARWWASPGVLTPGAHAMRLEAEDRAGNRAVVSWTLHVGQAKPEGPGWPEASLRVELDPPVEGATWLGPLLAGTASGETLAADAFARRLGRPVAAVAEADSLDDADIRRLRRSQGLDPLDWAVTVHAAAWPDRDPLRLRPEWAEDLPEGAGLYLETRRGRWRHVGAPLRRIGGWTAELSGPGRYALLRDAVAPYLGPGPAEGILGDGPAATTPEVSPPRWAVAVIRLEDLGSGVDGASIEARWDGEELIVEPDLPRHRVLVAVPDDAAPGAHVLGLRAADRAGNIVERDYDLDLRPGVAGSDGDLE